ncbi:MAG: hypothetical protein HY332_19245 [Chloroflexi bacterium]|nr:hypothetical protein [Chloroflexota bacterium]
MDTSGMGTSQKWWGILPRFDPDAGNVVAEPPGGGYGYWAGAPSAVYDPESDRFYCYYRLRWPLSDRRGGVCRVVASRDPDVPAAEWELVWEATREQFGANSIERSALIRDPFSGEWRLYVSSETAQPYDRNPATWRVDLLQARSVSAFEPRERRIVMDAAMYGFSHVKDPVVLVAGGEYLVLTSVAWRDQHLGPDDAGVVSSRGRGMIALHRSLDGIDFPTAQVVAEPGPQGWGGINVRPAALVYVAPCWTLLFDEGTTRADSYDEQTHLAVSDDLRTFRRLRPSHAPWVRSSYATGSVRYVDVVLAGDTAHYFYEYAREDRAHELRHAAVRL